MDLMQFLALKILAGHEAEQLETMASLDQADAERGLGQPVEAPIRFTSQVPVGRTEYERPGRQAPRESRASNRTVHRDIRPDSAPWSGAPMRPRDVETMQYLKDRPTIYDPGPWQVGPDGEFIIDYSNFMSPALHMMVNGARGAKVLESQPGYKRIPFNPEYSTVGILLDKMGLYAPKGGTRATTFGGVPR